MARTINRRLGREFWEKVITRFEGSGQSHLAFCATERLNIGSFRTWLYRIREERQTQVPSFVEITPSQAPVAACVVRANGIEFEFAIIPGPDHLIKLAKALGRKR